MRDESGGHGAHRGARRALHVYVRLRFGGPADDEHEDGDQGRRNEEEKNAANLHDLVLGEPRGDEQAC